MINLNKPGLFFVGPGLLNHIRGNIKTIPKVAWMKIRPLPHKND